MASDDENDRSEGDEDLSEGIFQTSEVRIDDGGSNLTDRFKYKVNVHYCRGTMPAAGLSH